MSLTSTTPPTVPGLRLGSVVGRGATSTVWAAIREEDRSAVAVKVIAPERYHIGALMELAARESAILDLVHHEHIIRLHEVHPLADGSVAVVLDLADGGTLADLLAARGRLSPGETATICTPVASALAALHQAGVIHGDVSPRNVLFTRDGRPMLADFEAARLVGESHPPVVAGTAGFLAPEVLGGGLPTQASDVYAVGALVWFALTGRALGARGGGGGEGGGSAGPVRAPDHAEALGLVGPEFAPVVVALLADDPASRPSAQEAAVRCYEAATPAPVSLGAVPTSAEPGVALTQRLRNPGAADPLERSATAAPTPPAPLSTAPLSTPRAAPVLPPGGRSPSPGLAPSGSPGSGDPAAPTWGATWPPDPGHQLSGPQLPAPEIGAPDGRPSSTGAARVADPGSAAPTPATAPSAAARAPIAERSIEAGRRNRRASRRGPLDRPWVRVVGMLVLGALVTAGLVGLLVQRHGVGAVDPGLSTPSATATARPQGSGAASSGDRLRIETAAVVSELSTARAQALMSGDPARLGSSDAPNSALLEADITILDSLRRSGQRYTGLAFTVRSAEWVSGDDTSARVLAVVDRSAYDVVGPSGERQAVPAEPGRPLVYSLMRTPEGWRIADVQA